MKHTILCVDDEVDIVDTLERLFRKNYRVLKATSGPQALKILDKEPVSLIISDQRMPEMTGVDFLKKSISIQPEAIKILLTGYTDIESVISAINSGQIYRYVTKPWDPHDLLTAVTRGIERFEMTAELKEKNKSLSEALNELKTLDEAKSNFMILINHELKTPLTAVLSFLELLKETPLNDDQQKYLNRIEQSSLRLKSIIGDVLELVSAQTGQMSFSPSKIVLKDTLQKLSEDFESKLKDKNQSLKTNIKVKQAFGDSKIVNNVLRRLFDNAVKFGTPGSTIHFDVFEDDDSTIFEISNEGNGLSEDKIKNLLKPFTLNENIMHHSKGLGLGLSVSQALLNRHGSQLEISSKNKRTVARFSISNS